MSDFSYDLGFIGCGNMAKAIIAGLKKSNESIKIAVSDLNDCGAVALGCTYFASNKELLKNCKYIIFAVKPYHAQMVFDEIKDVVTIENCIISIMAGVKIAKFEQELECVKKIIRVMPNLAATVGQSMSAMSFCPAVEESDKIIAKMIFQSVGKVAVVEENQLHAVTAISGSGPAYVYEFIKAMENSGVVLGLDKESSRLLTLQTIRGAVSMVENSSKPIDEMISAVCSKGGTTIEAINVLHQHEFDTVIDTAIKACFNRSKEIAGDN